MTVERIKDFLRKAKKTYLIAWVAVLVLGALTLSFYSGDNREWVMLFLGLILGTMSGSGALAQRLLKRIEESEQEGTK